MVQWKLGIEWVQSYVLKLCRNSIENCYVSNSIGIVLTAWKMSGFGISNWRIDFMEDAELEMNMCECVNKNVEFVLYTALNSN